jgi:hypothetical protein
MAAAKGQDRQAWEARAIALADERHTIGTPRYIGSSDPGVELWQAPSRAHGGCYVVRVWRAIDAITCSCTAATFGRPCCHAGAVLVAQRQRETSAGRSEAWRSWINGGEW